MKRAAVATPRGAASPPPHGTGPLLFARFAHAAAVGGDGLPSTSRPARDTQGAQLGGYLARGVVDGHRAEVESEFAGAWPYLELIAAASGADRLDRRVVEAYWIGNPLVDAVPAEALHRMLSAWARTVGVPSEGVADAVATMGVAHHSFHVLCVLPWSRGPDASRARQLAAMEGCRVRWARVLEVGERHAAVRVRRLEWHGRLLGFGPPVVEEVLAAVEGRPIVGHLQPGEWVAVHWGRVCDRITPRQAQRLCGYTAKALQLVPALAGSG